MIPVIVPECRALLSATFTLERTVECPHPPTHQMGLRAIRSLACLFFQIQFGRMSAKTNLIGCRTNAVDRQAKTGGRDNLVNRKATTIDPADGNRHDLSAREDAGHDIHILLVHASSFAICLSIFHTPYYRTHVCIL